MYTIPLSRIRAPHTPQLEARILDHFAQWRDTAAPDGWTGTVDAILNVNRTFGDPGHSMPIETVRDLLAPPDSSPCKIPGITVDTTALPWLITKES